jgi:hypothetical protein
MLRSETKDIEAIEEGKYISWDDLVCEHSAECSPKESHPFAVRSGVQVQPWSPDVNRFIRQRNGLAYLEKWKQLADSDT